VKKGLLLPLLLAVLTLGWVGAAQPGTAVAAAACDGVWVVVDFGSLGGISTECATSYGSGAAALRSAGFDPTFDDGMLTKIAGKPSTPDLSKAYWSYWAANRRSDGSYSGWSYSNLGASSSHPKQGNAEGWHYLSLSDAKAPPAAAPPKGETPAPTPTPTKPSPKPSPTATKSATAKPSATASPTRTATASAPATASPSERSTSPAPPTAAATPTGSATATPTATAMAEAGVSPAQPAPDNGSPIGAIAVGAVVVVGGAGLGGWWLLKGRRR
jgi:hypothetical protein